MTDPSNPWVLVNKSRPLAAGGALSARQQIGQGFQGLKLATAGFDNDRRQDLLVTNAAGDLML